MIDLTPEQIATLPIEERLRIGRQQRQAEAAQAPRLARLEPPPALVQTWMALPDVAARLDAYRQWERTTYESLAPETRQGLTFRAWRKRVIRGA